MSTTNKLSRIRVRRFLAALGAVLAVPVMSAGVMVATAGQSEAVSSLCTGRVSGLPGHWTEGSKVCSYTSPNTANWPGRIKITWSAQPGTQQYACVEARMGKAANPDNWQSIGCGKSNSGYISWPRNTLSMVEIRVKSMNIGLANVEYSI
ncbi:hypothetical protein ORV05_25110 [Amycolatopsis cynarae]|uniref:Secreted protein n=1 Tax=Amycolatopsis cynarae TaxID=2995223 RepID=A0ABY7AZ64_9PSEU|nr:hypothetical protein [Amycolatopsis sp. HUAS 11-8]WAL64237.1 hypothetical protein ORV05_25110 [Amycolatopsis sp. HUAS 11-8]